ncbi:hypothetical protein E4U41_000465 [Claviceps citrina]|nr:hypothetical protein E4U41_000465 [Claviceps citrina]
MASKTAGRRAIDAWGAIYGQEWFIENSVPNFPPEDSKLRATHLQVRTGGNCPNALQVLQQLLLLLPPNQHAVQLHLLCSLPDKDAPSTKRLLDSLRRQQQQQEPSPVVDLGHCFYRKGHTEPASSYVIRSRERDSRTIVNYNALPEMSFGEFAAVMEAFADEGWVGDGEETWWHFEGRIPDTTLSCIRLLRQRLPSAKISVEVEKPGREGLAELAAEADVVFYSRSWAEGRGHASAESCLTNEHRKEGSLGLCTWGADGATAMSRELGACLHCPVQQHVAAERVTVIDPVGAGDAFIAGMLYGLVINDWPLVDVSTTLSCAVKLATLKVQRDGFDGLAVDMLSR